MVSFMGLFWRDGRRGLTRRQWNKNRTNFIEHVCALWSLTSCHAGDPEPAQKNLRQAPGGEKEKLTFCGEYPEPDELTDTVAGIVPWGRNHGCVLYVTDSQSLQEVLCGKCVCKNTLYEPLLARVVDRFVDHLRCKWSPPQRWSDPVVWMPRCHNKVADGLADFTMDRRTSWQQTYTTTMTPAQSNIIVQTDGGLRKGDCAAASWVIGFWSSDAQSFEPYEAGGVFLNTSCTVFMAEAIAIDEASASVQRLLRASNT